MKQDGYFHRVHTQTPTRMWINNVSRSQAKEAIEAGAVGCTQNPSYVWKMMNNEEERPYVFEKLDIILQSEPDDNQALIKLQRELVEGIANIFMDIYEKSHGEDGYVSIQGDPFDESVDTIVECARYNTENLPNMTAKIPVVEGGIAAIKELAPERVPINTTEIMTVDQVMTVLKLYEEACEKIKNPAHMYYSVITGIYDEHLHNFIKENNIDISSDLMWQAGMAVAKKCYWMVKERKSNLRFIGGGARGLHHFTEMVGADAIVTINWKGTADKLIDQNPPVVQRFFMPVPHSVEDELINKVGDFRRAYMLGSLKPEEYEDFGAVVLFRSQFESAWKNALKAIRECRTKIK